MDTVRVKVSAKGQVVIPKKFREKYGLEPGTEVLFIERDGSLTIVKAPRDPIEEGFGILRKFGDGRSWTQELLKERAREREREEKKLERWLRS